ncbi:MAG TPA: histidine phosphatase family protein [Polyangiaceae bacterium]|nr:histidine phosphatase family protein [Polyangiaceae bacterium]
MSTLHLVRHAQASFLAEDYDVLSELGHDQARRLGTYFASLGYQFDAVYSGPRQRQIHTAELAREAMREAGGIDWPELVVLPELDEYQAEGIMKSEVPKLMAERPEIAALLEQFQGSADKRARMRAFERVLQTVMRMWAGGQLDLSEGESWTAFTERVAEGMRRMTVAESSGQRILAFSSGGAIGVAIADILKAPYEQALELGWALNNASVSDVLFSAERKNLSRFNVLSHLANPSLWTYR